MRPQNKVPEEPVIAIGLESGAVMTLSSDLEARSTVNLGSSRIQHLCSLPDGHIVAATQSGELVRINARSSAIELRRTTAFFVNGLAFVQSADGPALLVLDGRGALRLLNPMSLQVQAEVALEGALPNVMTTGAMGVVYSNEAGHVRVTSPSDLSTMRYLPPLDPYCVAIEPIDATHFAALCSQGVLLVYDLAEQANGRVSVGEVVGARALAMTDAGLVVAGDKLSLFAEGELTTVLDEGVRFTCLSKLGDALVVAREDCLMQRWMISPGLQLNQAECAVPAAVLSMTVCE